MSLPQHQKNESKSLSVHSSGTRRARKYLRPAPESWVHAGYKHGTLQVEILADTCPNIAMNLRQQLPENHSNAGNSAMRESVTLC